MRFNPVSRPAGNYQYAAKSCNRFNKQIGFLQSYLRAMGRLLKFLRRSIIDLPRIKRKKISLRDGLAGADRQDEIIFARRGACIPAARQRLWDQSVSLCEKLRMLLVQASSRTHRQTQMQVSMLRNANFAASDPLGVGSEFRRAAADSRWRVNCKREQDFIVIAVIKQFFARLQPLRTRPLYFSGAEAKRQLPVKRRRLAGVTRIDPVNVPAFLQDEVNAQLQVRVGLHRRLPRKQFHARMLRRSLGAAAKGTRKRDDEAGGKANVQKDGHNRILSRKKRRPLTGALCCFGQPQATDLRKIGNLKFILQRGWLRARQKRR